MTNELAETTVQRDEWKRIAEDRGIELERLRADISQAYDLRDKAEGRYCTALGAIEQLHAAVKTAQELAARRLMEIEQLKVERDFARRELDRACQETREALSREVAAVRGSPEPCEQRSEVNSIDDVAAICHSVTGLCCHILGSPGGPCTIGNCAAVRGYLGGPEFAQGASRDASSESYPAFMYCPKCGELYTGRGGTDGLQMTLTCPNQHSWTDPRPTELRT